MIYFGSNFRSASRGALHSPTFVYQVCALRCATTAVLNITGLAAVFASLSLSLSFPIVRVFVDFDCDVAFLAVILQQARIAFARLSKWFFAGYLSRLVSFPYWPTDWNAKLGSGLAAGRKLLCFWGPTQSTCCPSLDTSCGDMFSSFTASIEKRTVPWHTQTYCNHIWWPPHTCNHGLNKWQISHYLLTTQPWHVFNRRSMQKLPPVHEHEILMQGHPWQGNG